MRTLVEWSRPHPREIEDGKEGFTSFSSLEGAEPEVILWPEPGEWPLGVDRQCAEAIERLKKDGVQAKDQPRPELRKASEW